MRKCTCYITLCEVLKFTPTPQLFTNPSIPQLFTSPRCTPTVYKYKVLQDPESNPVTSQLQCSTGLHTNEEGLSQLWLHFQFYFPHLRAKGNSEENHTKSQLSHISTYFSLELTSHSKMQCLQRPFFYFFISAPHIPQTAFS